MASLTPWTWVWVNSGSWWWTGRPGVLRFMGSQSVGHDWATELNWTEGRVWGSYSLVFIPAPFSRGEGWFLSLFSLDQKCQGVSSKWVLLICKANLIVMRAQWTTGHSLKARDSCLSLSVFVYCPDTYHPKCMVSYQSRGSCFLLSAHGPLLFTICMISCHLAPDPISLRIPSHLPAGTVFCTYYLFLILGVLNWHQKIFFLTSCYRCFYILVKLFLYGIVLKMGKKRMNSCSVLFKHLAISIFMMKFSSDRTKHCNGTSQILNP